jgi:hypothetical protein
MILVGLALLAGFAAAAGQGPQLVVPNSPDLTIRTRVVIPGSHGETVIRRLKGARQSIDRIVDGVHAPTFSFGPRIGQCDRRRVLMLYPDQRTYAFFPIEDPTASVSRGAATRARMVTSVHVGGSPQERITIDAVDTGERRAFAGLTARHVVTTTKTETAGDAPGPVRTRVQDGWYVDLPPDGCVDWGETSFTFTAVGVVSREGDPEPALPQITHLGRAKRGYALMETDRIVSRDWTMTQTTELLEISNAPIDPSVFEPPKDYRAALPLWGGGFDFTRPDTPANRAMLLWEGVRDFASRWFR